MTNKIFFKDFLLMAYVWQTEIEPKIRFLQNDFNATVTGRKKTFDIGEYESLLKQLFSIPAEDIKTSKKAVVFLLERSILLTGLETAIKIPAELKSAFEEAEDVFRNKIDAKAMLKRPPKNEARQARDKLFRYLQLDRDGNGVCDVPHVFWVPPRLDLVRP
jgi:hypothetical protein